MCVPGISLSGVNQYSNVNLPVNDLVFVPYDVFLSAFSIVEVVYLHSELFYYQFVPLHFACQASSNNNFSILSGFTLGSSSMHFHIPECLSSVT